jgi:TPR repeat protein
VSSTQRRAVGTTALALLATALASCGGPDRAGDDARPSRTYPDDPEADAHVREGLRLFADADGSPDARSLLERARREFAAAAAKVPSPANRIRRIRTELLLREIGSQETPERDPKEALDELLGETPDDAPTLALRAFVDGCDAREDDAVERAERACAVAGLSSDRAVRCLVGDELAEVAKLLLRGSPEKAIAVMVDASELGSPVALLNTARLYWSGRGVAIDRSRAIELASKAEGARFTREERERGLLVDEDAASRLAARVLGSMLIHETRFEEARAVLARGIADEIDAAVPGGEPNPEFDSAVAELGALEARGLGGPVDTSRARTLLEPAAKAGRSPALELLGRLEADSGHAERAQELFSLAAKNKSLVALAALGEWELLDEAARDRASHAPPSPEKLYDLRTAVFALALQKGPDARAAAEEKARSAVEGAPENLAAARQLRHIAGDLTAADLQATMPKSATLARWRAETELALATRALLLGNRDEARAHLEACAGAQAITQPEGELAWGALRAWH